MRKRYRVLILAAIVAAFVVPVGFALSLESGAAGTTVRPVTLGSSTTPSAARVVAPVAHRGTADAKREAPWPVSDGAALLVAGSALFAIATAMRRAA